MGRCDFPKAAPLITFTAKKQFFAMAVLTLFMTIISYAALSRVDHVIKVQDLDNQEQISWKR